MICLVEISSQQLSLGLKRLETILSSKKGEITLKHTKDKSEQLIIGKVGTAIFIYNTEPDLIRAFEYEGANALKYNKEEAVKRLFNRAASNYFGR